MDMKYILLERRNDIAIMKFNRPEALNAVSVEFLREIRRALKSVAQGDARVLIITSAVDKAFISGADIREMSQLRPEAATEFVERGQKVMNTIEYLPIPVIAAVNGYALGGGMELALACDMIFASEKAKFGQPEVKLGIIPGFGGTQRLPKLIGRNLAKELIYTGDIIDARRAKEIGLVNEVFPHESLLEEVIKVAQRISQVGALAVAAAKKSIYDGFHESFDQGCQIEAKAFVGLFGTSDQKEGMQAFLDKRSPKFSGKLSATRLI